MSLMDVFTGAVSGGATGIIGAGLSLINKFFTAKQEQAHRLEMQEKEMAYLKLEADTSIRIENIVTERQVINSDAQTHVASFEHDKATYTSGKARNNWVFIVVDAFRGIIRPFVTVYTIVCLSMLVFMLLGDPSIKAQMMKEIVGMLTELVAAFVYITVTATVWWFGARIADTNKKS